MREIKKEIAVWYLHLMTPFLRLIKVSKHQFRQVSASKIKEECIIRINIPVRLFALVLHYYIITVFTSSSARWENK